MPNFRKKPAVIEARQLTWDNIEEVMAWCGATRHYTPKPFRSVGGIYVPVSATEEVQTHFGDWVIKGVAGEFYPCKPDIFDATYEPADGEAA